MRSDAILTSEGLGPRDVFQTSGRGYRILLIAIVACGLLGLYPFQRSIDQQLAATSGPRDQLLFIPSQALFARLSGGYSGLLATLYWTRTVQYYGRLRLAHAQSFPLLGPLLDITTSLDPHLLIAYRFGSIFLAEKPPDGAGNPGRAIHLLERGIVSNPEYWPLWEDLGFVYYWDLKDYAHAARAFQTGSERPGALPWMRTLAASVSAKGGEFETSRILWTEIGRTAGNDSIRLSAELHLAALDTQQALHELDALLAEYRAKQGHDAHSWQDLVTAGFLREIPHDLSGEPFVIKPDRQAGLSPKSQIQMNLLN